MSTSYKKASPNVCGDAPVSLYIETKSKLGPLALLQLPSSGDRAQTSTEQQKRRWFRDRLADGLELADRIKSVAESWVDAEAAGLQR